MSAADLAQPLRQRVASEHLGVTGALELGLATGAVVSGAQQQPEKDEVREYR